VGETQLNLAELYFLQQRDEEADRQVEEIVSIYEAKAATDQSLLVSVYNTCATLYLEAGRAEPARMYLEKARQAIEERSGAEPELAVVLKGLAVIDRHQGDFEGAETKLRRALSIFENSIGPEHSEFAGTLAHLSEVYLNLHPCL